VTQLTYIMCLGKYTVKQYDFMSIKFHECRTFEHSRAFYFHEYAKLYNYVNNREI